MDIIQAENISFSYANSPKIFDDISFQIKEGDFVLLCGLSGCGKTTLLKHLKHTIAPFGNFSGNIYYKNKAVNLIDKYTLASEIGYVFQSPDKQIVSETPSGEIAFGLENLGIRSGEIRRRVAEMVGFFGIGSFFENDIQTLSGGQKQLINLASIMVMQPDVLLLDEPGAMLDPISRNDFIFTLNRLNKELGLTIIICEHQLDTIFPIVDKVLYMENQKLYSYHSAREAAYQLIETPMAAALPSAARIYLLLENQGRHLTLTTRDCRKYLSNKLQDNQFLYEEEKFTSLKPISFQLKNCFFKYEKQQPNILLNLSMEGRNSDFIGIVGGNGSGKTTLLNILAKVIVPYYGRLKINGNGVILPQNPQTLFCRETIREDIKNLIDRNHLDKDMIENLISKYTFFEQIRTLYELNPLDLSGGELQKIALFKLLLLSPAVLLLDEPTKGLDSFNKRHLGKMLVSLLKDGICIVMVSHDLEFCAEYCTTCGMLFNGCIVSMDTPCEFFSTNHFYTTETGKIAKDMIAKAVCPEHIKTVIQKEDI